LDFEERNEMRQTELNITKEHDGWWARLRCDGFMQIRWSNANNTYPVRFAAGLRVKSNGRFLLDETDYPVDIIAIYPADPRLEKPQATDAIATTPVTVPFAKLSKFESDTVAGAARLRLRLWCEEWKTARNRGKSAKDAAASADAAVKAFDARWGPTWPAGASPA
jgi:hypothetical protein